MAIGTRRRCGCSGRQACVRADFDSSANQDAAAGQDANPPQMQAAGHATEQPASIVPDSIVPTMAEQLGAGQCRSSLTERAWYFSGVTIDPQNSDVVYMPNVALYARKMAGRQFRSCAARRAATIITRSGSIPQIPRAWFSGRTRELDQPRPRQDLEQLVQPADGAALSRDHRQPVSLHGVWRAAG